jgi:hypothetical protein
MAIRIYSRTNLRLRGLGVLTTTELWKLHKLSRTRLILLTMVSLPAVSQLLLHCVLGPGAGLVGEGSIAIMPFLAGIITAVIGISSLEADFSTGALCNFIINGATRWQVVLAKGLAATVVASLATGSWGLSVLATSASPVSLLARIPPAIAASVLASLACCGLMMPVAFIRRSSSCLFAALVAYLADVAMSAMTGSTNPLIRHDQTGLLPRLVLELASFSITTNSLELVRSATLAEMCVRSAPLVLISATGFWLSALVFSHQDLV